MKIELSKKELQDIYEDLGAAVMEESSTINIMEKDNKAEYKNLLQGFKNRQKRRMVLINKIAKLAGYQEN